MKVWIEIPKGEYCDGCQVLSGQTYIQGGRWFCFLDKITLEVDKRNQKILKHPDCPGKKEG